MQCRAATAEVLCFFVPKMAQILNLPTCSASFVHGQVVEFDPDFAARRYSFVYRPTKTTMRNQI